MLPGRGDLGGEVHRDGDARSVSSLPTQSYMFGPDADATSSIGDATMGATHIASFGASVSATTEAAWIAALVAPAVHIGRLELSDVRVLATAQASAPVFLSVNQMPLRLSAVVLVDVRAVPARLTRELLANYIADAVRAWCCVVGACFGMLSLSWLLVSVRCSLLRRWLGRWRCWATRQG